MKTKSKTVDIFTSLGYISILLLVLGLNISLWQQDLRYIALSIILFGILYTGNISLFLFFRMMPKDESWVNRIGTAIPAGLFSFLSLLIIFYGIALYLHHYDQDWLIDIYTKYARQIDSFIK